MEGAIIGIEAWLVEGVAETLPWVELSTIEKGCASLSGICSGTRRDSVSVNSTWGVCPSDGCACSDVDVKWLKCVVHYGNGVGRCSTVSCRKRGRKRWKKVKNDNHEQENNILRLRMPKRWKRPFEGAAAMATLILV